VPALEPVGDLRLGSRPAVILEVRDLARQAGLSGNLFTLVVAAGGPGRDPASTAVVEAPEGATLQQIIFELGGGLPEGKELKAVRLGGPAGGFLPASLLDTVATEEALARAGVRLGSATLEAISADSCLVSLAGEALELLAEENCARCVVCREGTMQMAEILGDLTGGRSRPGDLEVLGELARALELLGKCDWGRCAAKPVLTALAHFRDEFESHARSRTCPAGVCRMAGEAR
jgi:NADH:ubiquinone oxidoreductase subunit F (NADH-binding)